MTVSGGKFTNIRLAEGGKEVGRRMEAGNSPVLQRSWQRGELQRRGGGEKRMDSRVGGKINKAPRLTGRGRTGGRAQGDSRRQISWRG